MDLRRATASQEVPLGVFVDSTDGNTAETGLTIANTDIKIWKAGATVLANKNSGGATHIANGIYYAVFDATDTDTVGPGAIFVHVAGALAVTAEFNVLHESVYDVKYGTSAVSTLSPAAVNAEIVDALATDTYAEPGQGVPAATVSLSTKVSYLYKFLRNKITQDSTTLRVYADDEATVDHKATVSDNGTTYTRGEITTGP